MARGVERQLLLLASLVYATGYGLLAAASVAAPHRLLDPILQERWPHWPSALLVVFSGWLVHLMLVRRRSTADELLLPLASLLVGVGWLEVLRLQPDGALRQAVWVGLSAVACVLWLRLVPDYRPLQDYRTLLLVLAVGLQLLVMTLGTEVNGARLWLRLGPLSFQPVEVIKVLLVLYLASYLRDYRELLSVGFLRGRLVAVRYLVPLVALMAGCEAIFARQKDLGIGLLLFGVFILLFFVTTRRYDFILLGSVLFGLLGWACYLFFPYIRVRFMAWMNPWPGADSWGFQMVQSLYALASGGITGTGLGLGQPWHIPEVHTDFIFVALTEELGLVGAAALMMLYLMLVQRAFRTAGLAIRAGEEFGAILAWGLGATLLVQTFIIVSGTIKMLPMTGITLPFVSYGGSSLLTNYLLLAMLMQISERAGRGAPAVATAGRLRLSRVMAKASRACLLLLLLPLLYLTGFEVVFAPALAASVDNPRNAEDLQLRGGFLARNGAPLARTELERDSIRRVYPLGALTAHTVGYWHRRYGTAGLEQTYDSLLKGPGLPRTPGMALRNMEGQPLAGPDAVLTLDPALQRVAADALGQRRGAVVALDVESGDILASVSYPTFDPNHLERDWALLNTDPAAPLLDRVQDGYYPPGSVFKLVTLAAGLDSHVIAPTDVFYCPGFLDVDGYRLHCNQGEAHGAVDVRRALAVSCNVAFAQMALKIGADRFAEEMHKLLPEAHLAAPRTRTELAQEGFGQGTLGVAPIDVARLVAEIARGGRSVTPRMLRAWKTGDHTQVLLVDPGTQVMSSDTAQTIGSMMETVVQSGTGTAAQISNVRVAGKTGTAENPNGPPHAWFAAYAPADKPKIVVVAIIENGGYGGDVAAPVVRQVLQAALGIR